jgi:hypothetical protein
MPIKSPLVDDYSKLDLSKTLQKLFEFVEVESNISIDLIQDDSKKY